MGVRGNIVIRTTFSNGQLVRQETEREGSCEEDEDHSDESYDEDDDEDDDDDNDEDDDDDDEDEDDDDNYDMEDDDKCECDDRENRHRRINNRENTIKIQKVFQNGQLVEINREEI